MAWKNDDPCRDKVGETEPIFTLRAQDITAAMTVDFWVYMNAKILLMLAHGHTPETSINTVMHAARSFMSDFDTTMTDKIFDPTVTEKITEAASVAELMRAWKGRKIAD